MEYSDSLLMAVLMVVLYLTVLCESSLEYRSYLKSSNPLEARQKAHHICIFSGLAFVSPLIVVFALFLFTALPSLPLITLGAIVLVVMFLSIYVVRQRRFFKCSEKREEELDGIKFVVCRSRVVDAWYNLGDKRIYVSSRLKEVLSKEEFKAVIHHEQGYERHRKLILLGLFVYGYWIWTLAIIVTLATFLQISPISVFTLLLLGASLTLPAIMISWIREHEVDREAFLKVGFQPFMTALIKIHVYGSFGEFLDDVKVKGVREMIGTVVTSITPWRIFIILLKYSWNFPQGILDLFTNPHYHTQLPLQLRLALLRQMLWKVLLDMLQSPRIHMVRRRGV